MSNLQDNKPFTDAEIPSAMCSIVADPLFPQVAKYIYPDRSLDEVKSFLLGINSVRDLQGKVMRRNMDRILTASQSFFSYHISPKVARNKPYLFVSNHRDITLDAMLLQCALYDEGYETSQIIFGTNLLSIPLMGLVGRANKMVGIERGGNPKEFFQCLSHLSDYLRDTITNRHESVWIAQGNGRTKDGNDTTVPAIVKMFAMSSAKPLSAAIADLNPVPVSVSYEYEPCAAQKAIEVAKSRREGHYEKSSDEDYMSVLSGLTKKKGHIHIEVGDPLTVSELADCHDDANAVAALFDRHICANYRLHSTNFVAYDIQSGTTTYSSRYTASDKDCFFLHMLEFKGRINRPDCCLTEEERPMAEEIFLNIYANPVKRIVIV